MLQALVGRQVVRKVAREAEPAVADLSGGEREHADARPHEVPDLDVRRAAIVVNVQRPLRESVRVACLYEAAGQDRIEQTADVRADLQFGDATARGAVTEKVVAVTRNESRDIWRDGGRALDHVVTKIGTEVLSRAVIAAE